MTIYLIGVNVEINLAPVQAKPTTSDEYMQVLENVSKLVAKTPVNPAKSQSSSSQDDIEVFEVGNEKEEPVSPYAHIFEGGKKTRPNDPCPCGSGKKYKRCHGDK